METRGKPGHHLLLGSEGPAFSLPSGLFPQSPEFKGASGPPHEHLLLSSGAKQPSSWSALHPLAWWCGASLGSTPGFKDLEDSESTQRGWPRDTWGERMNIWCFSFDSELLKSKEVEIGDNPASLSPSRGAGARRGLSPSVTPPKASKDLTHRNCSHQPIRQKSVNKSTSNLQFSHFKIRFHECKDGGRGPPQDSGDMRAKSWWADLRSTVHITDWRSGPLRSVPRNTLYGILAKNEANPEVPRSPRSRSADVGHPPYTSEVPGVACSYRAVWLQSYNTFLERPQRTLSSFRIKARHVAWNHQNPKQQC